MSYKFSILLNLSLDSNSIVTDSNSCCLITTTVTIAAATATTSRRRNHTNLTKLLIRNTNNLHNL